MNESGASSHGASGVTAASEYEGKMMGVDMDDLLMLGIAARMAALPRRERVKHKRAGITKNKGQKRNKQRAQMARESRRRNRVR